MTDTPTVQLTPAQINEAVAIHVMVWGGIEKAWYGEEGERRWMSEWNPSTDIKDAWEVVEHINATKGSVFMECRMTMGGQYRWRVSYTDTVLVDRTNEWGEHEREGEALADTAPMAICLAALKAVER